MLAERLGKNLFKGYQVVLEGQLRQDRWEGENGKRSKVKIVADRVVSFAKPQPEDDMEIPNENKDDKDEDIPF